MKHNFLHIEVYSVETILPDRDLVSSKDLAQWMILDDFKCYGHYGIIQSR